MKCNGCGMEIISEVRGVCPYCGSVLVSDESEVKVVKNSSLSRAELSGESIYEQSILGMLEIYTNCGSGSGFLISNDGFALTNTHVVVDENNIVCKKIKVKLLGQSISAEVVKLGDNKSGLGNGIDLAVIKLSQVPDGAAPFILADSQSVKVAEKVYAIGNSLGYGTCITSGIVSDNKRKKGNQTYIMTDCAVNHGNSGGPLLNAEGKVIGVLTRIEFNLNIQEVADGMKYAIPSNEAKNFAMEFIKCT